LSVYPLAYFSALRPTFGRAEFLRDAMNWLKPNNLNPGRSSADASAMRGDFIAAYRAGSELSEETPPPR
jgi:hypothetical protein